MAKKKALKGGGTNAGTIPLPKKKVAKKTPKAKTGDETKSAGQSGKFAENQPPLAGAEDTDERISELDELCKRVLANSAKRKSLKEETDDHLEQIGQLLKDNDLELYIMQGEKFFIEPGVSKVTHKKVQQKG